MFGLGVLALTVNPSPERFWSTIPPNASPWSNYACWDFTTLGPTNTLTCRSGPGPGFGLDYFTRTLTMSDSYSGCYSSSFHTGALLATLTGADRQ